MAPLADLPTATSGGDPALVGFVTVVAQNYLPGARVLARSLLVHEGLRLVVVVADLPAGGAFVDDDFDVVGPDQLPIPEGELARMAMLYTVTEFSTALKPFALRWLLERGSDAAVYLDPDMVLYAPLDGLREHLAAAEVVLTPHVLSPMPRDGMETSEYTLRRCGIFNLGFLGVSSRGSAFLEWFGERLLRDAISDSIEMLYADQKWADWAPALFDVAVWRDPGVNVAYWNLHERQPVEDEGSITCGGRPLRLFHFSGFDPAQPDVFSSRPGARYRVEEVPPAVQALSRAYAAEMSAAGSARGRSLTYGFAATPNGYRLEVPTRRHARVELLRAEADGRPLPPTPFADEVAFARWLAEPVACAGATAPRALAIGLAVVTQKPAADAPEGLLQAWLTGEYGSGELTRYNEWAAVLGISPLDAPAAPGAGHVETAQEAHGMPVVAPDQPAGLLRRIVRRMSRIARR